MSSKTKNITELIEQLQAENESAKNLKRLFDQAVKSEFGFDVKTLHEKLTKLAQIEKKCEEQKAQVKQQAVTASMPSPQGQHSSFM